MVGHMPTHALDANAAHACAQEHFLHDLLGTAAAGGLPLRILTKGEEYARLGDQRNKKRKAKKPVKNIIDHERISPF